MMLEHILSEVSSSGPIGFDRFMEMALYDSEGGYFASGRLRSERDGDFLTSPEVSPRFGETIARFVAVERERVGEPFTVAEVGGGSGSLLRPLLDAVGFEPTSVVAVERSEAARDAIAAAVPEAMIATEVPPMRGVIVANELLDNLPAALVVRRGTEWRERLVGLDGNALVLIESEPRPEVAQWADDHAGPVPEGGVAEVQIAACRWVEDMIGRLEAGVLVAFDYGDISEGLASRRPEGTMRTYRAHHLGPDPLAEPGSTDITMDVNFTAMIAAAGEAGAVVEYVRQDEFLEEWGLRDQLIGLREEELVAARQGRAMERLRLKSEIVGGETLLHPRGLGDFRVMICRK